MSDANNGNGSRRLLEVDQLRKYFPIEKGFLRRVTGHVKAVDRINLYINEGETLGLVGESGCGKTTLGRCILRAIEPTDGSVNFQFSASDERLDITQLDKKRLRAIRRHMQMIFQDPYSSLDPRMTVLDIVAEPLVSNSLAKGQELEDRVKELMRVVGLEVKHLKRYPHAFSGGQRQRIGIARALAPRPEFIVCDEAVSALDVSIQAQILNLLQDLQAEFNLTYLFIAHDLSVIEHISDRVGVMYVGKMVELASTEQLFGNPKHPTPRRCCRRCRSPIRRPRWTASSSPARWQTPPTRPPAATSIRVASTPRTSARPSSRSGRKWNRVTSRPATSPRSSASRRWSRPTAPKSAAVDPHLGGGGDEPLPDVHGQRNAVAAALCAGAHLRQPRVQHLLGAGGRLTGTEGLQKSVVAIQQSLQGLEQVAAQQQHGHPLVAHQRHALASHRMGIGRR